MTASKNLYGLYVITDTTHLNYDEILNYLPHIFKNGVRILQLRDKSLDFDELFFIAKKIQLICKKYKVYFIINDNIDLALKLNADGIHLGKEDTNYLQFAKLRKTYKGILGISCYSDIKQALHYEKLKASYVAFGACFKSSTKTQASTIPLDILAQAKKQLQIPICAIGGININNIKQLPKNIDMLAVISDIWSNDNLQNTILKTQSINKYFLSF